VDALGHLCVQALSGAGARRAASSCEVVIHIDAETGSAHLEDGPALPADTVERITCDAAVVEMAHRADGSVLDVGRRRRTVPAALRRAMASRDGGCVFPGCTHRRFIQGHHVQHWAHGGKTALENLISLCSHHHRLVHEGRVRVIPGRDGEWRFEGPQGRGLPKCQSVPGVQALPLGNEPGAPNWLQGVLAAVGVDEATLADELTAWNGDRISYDFAMHPLTMRASAEAQGRGVGAEARV
jgi:hypothetical protein